MSKNEPMNVGLQKHKLQELLRSFEYDPQKVDLEALIDPTLHYPENEDIILSELGFVEVELPEDQARYHEQQMRERETQHFKEQMKEANKKLDTVSLDKVYKPIIEAVKILPKAESLHALFIEGRSGWGKTHTIRKTLVDLGYEQDLNEKGGFHIISGKTTYLELVKSLYEYSNCSFILMDDLYGALESEGMLNILKEATDTIGKERFISNRTKKTDRYDLPEVFPFKPKLIVITNQIKKKTNPHVKALLNRGRVFTIDFDYKTKIRILKKVANEKGINKEVLDYLIDKTSEGTDFSIRTLLHAKDYYEHSDNWREHVSAELKMDKETALIMSLFKSDKSRTEQAKEYKEKTGRSKRTYYRRLNTMGLTN